jgi:hypothetical protein
MTGKRIQAEQPQESWGAKNPGKIRCPFVWKDGAQCIGHIVEAHELRAANIWAPREGGWVFAGHGQHLKSAGKLHLICSTHGEHAGADGFAQAGVIGDLDHVPVELARAVEDHKSKGGR